MGVLPYRYRMEAAELRYERWQAYPGKMA